MNYLNAHVVLLFLDCEKKKKNEYYYIFVLHSHRVSPEIM